MDTWRFKCVSFSYFQCATVKHKMSPGQCTESFQMTVCAFHKGGSTGAVNPMIEPLLWWKMEQLMSLLCTYCHIVQSDVLFTFSIHVFDEDVIQVVFLTSDELWISSFFSTLYFKIKHVWWFITTSVVFLPNTPTSASWNLRLLTEQHHQSTAEH